MGSDLPVARVDLPARARDRDFICNSIRDTFTGYAPSGTSVGIVYITADRAMAEEVRPEFAAGRDPIGIDTRLVLWADETRWANIDTGGIGLQTETMGERWARRQHHAERERSRGWQSL